MTEYRRQVRPAEPGDPSCPCGTPARAVLITRMGEVPTCKAPEDLAEEVVRTYQMANAAVLRSSGRSGTR